MMRIRAVALASLIILAVVPATPDARGVRVGRPLLGDWEGVGPHGLPFSFVLERNHGRIRVTDLTVGNPIYCPGRVLATDAIPQAKALYLGPGAEPLLRINWAPVTVEIRIGMGAPFAQEWDGKLNNARSMTLSEPVPVGLPKGCGWGAARRLVWHLAPAQRIHVTAGAWSGQTAVPGGGTDSVTLDVNATGRIVDNFQVKIDCPEGSTSWGVGPANVGAFISARGHFVDSYGSGFIGTFKSDHTVTGTLVGVVASGCGSGRLPFSARPTSATQLSRRARGSDIPRRAAPGVRGLASDR